MTQETHPYPGLFGGVSQQIPAMRHPTQCEAQENAMATLADGLFKRNGTRHGATLALTGPSGGTVAGSVGAATGHLIDMAPAARYQLILVNGSMCLYRTTSVAVQDVSFPNGTTYLDCMDPESDFRCVTVADYTFIVNRTKVPAMTATVVPANPTNVAFINVRTAAAGVVYTATINGVTVSVTSADPTTQNAIAEQLRAALSAALPTYSVFILPDTNIIKVTKASTVITCLVSDWWANTGLQSITAGVPKYSDLPPTFETGYTVQINGTAEVPVQPYWVKWTGTRWEESAKPGVTTTIDPATMPHQLVRNTNGTWTFRQCTWDIRKVGDDATAPLPSFIGTKINNVFFHRNRLGFLAGDSLVLSRSGSYFNFFPSSGSQVLATDPIDLAAVQENVKTLEWASVYKEALLVWADEGQQFSLVAGGALTPESARLQPTTTFVAARAVRPVSFGNKVLSLAYSGAYSQVGLYRVQEDSLTDYMQDLTGHIPTYIPSNVRMMAASPSEKLVVVVPKGYTKQLYVMQYETDESDRLTQTSWSRYTIATVGNTQIIYAFWDQEVLFLCLWVEAAGDPNGGRFYLQRIEMDDVTPDLNCDFKLRLDSKLLCTVGAFSSPNTAVQVPMLASAGQLTYLRCVPGLEPQVLVPVSETTNGAMLRTDVVLPGNLVGATIWAGRKYDFKYTFTEPILRDGSGVPLMAAAVKLVRIVVRYVKTGWFKAKVTPLLRGTYEYPMDGRVIGKPGQGATQVALSGGDFPIPVHTKSANATVSIESDSYLPVKLPYAEWVGDINYKAQRR